MAVFEENLIKLPKPNYKYITSEEEAKKAMEEISRHSIMSIDTECTALDPFKAKMSLIQIGVDRANYVFDIRGDTEFSDYTLDILIPILTNEKIKKILQNAAFDMKLIKLNTGYYLKNVYDTMLAEQLLHLGLKFGRANLGALVLKHLGIHMDKEPQGSFSDYYQKFKPYQLEYAANDVVVLREIMSSQMMNIKKYGLEAAADLEFDFLKPMCEMELNGITMDVDKWRVIMSDIDDERREAENKIASILNANESQNTLFGVSLINIDSNVQLKKALRKYGLEIDSTDVSELQKHAGLPLVDAILTYRKTQKLISTYGEALLDKISEITGRLHTDFRQMVSTGRMSSSNPNLQNIPKKQKFRSCFIAKPGYSLLTSDMSGAELRILGNVSADPIFVESYANGIDLHTRTASEVFKVPMENVTKEMRGAAKAINFGLCYGLSKYGLARRLKITEKKAEEMIETYFDRYRGVKKYLDQAASSSISNGYSSTISGRKRFYDVPGWEHPDRKRIVASIKRRGMNAGIQGANADTIKKAMVLLVDRLEQGGYDAKLVLTVHDEVVVEAKDDQRYEVAEVVSSSLVDGFGYYFHLIPMEADTLIGPCWLKDPCEVKNNEGNKCNCNEMKAIPDEKYGTKIVCSKCGAGQE
jgi:DNA polymerase I